MLSADTSVGDEYCMKHMHIFVICIQNQRFHLSASPKESFLGFYLHLDVQLIGLDDLHQSGVRTLDVSARGLWPGMTNGASRCCCSIRSETKRRLGDESRGI